MLLKSQLPSQADARASSAEEVDLVIWSKGAEVGGVSNGEGFFRDNNLLGGGNSNIFYFHPYLGR